MVEVAKIQICVPQKDAEGGILPSKIYFFYVNSRLIDEIDDWCKRKGFLMIPLVFDPESPSAIIARIERECGL